MERFILKKLLDWKNFPYRKLDDDVLNIPRFFWTATGAGIFQIGNCETNVKLDAQ